MPKLPGVYLMKGQKGEILYVGKAKNLKHRVKSYWRFSPAFRPAPDGEPRILKMLSEAAALEYLVVESEADALILEGSEAGGHIGHVSTIVLLQEILFDYGDRLPIFVAGGIADGRMIGHLCLMGAAGAQLGTRFVVAEECQAHPRFKEFFLKARARQAIATPQYSSQLPVVAVRRTSAPITIDGRVDPGEWTPGEKATVSVNRYKPEKLEWDASGGRAKSPSTVYLEVDDDNLYVAFINDVPAKGGIVGGRTWGRSDAVESGDEPLDEFAESVEGMENPWTCAAWKLVVLRLGPRGQGMHRRALALHDPGLGRVVIG